MKCSHDNPFDTLCEFELNSPSDVDLLSEKDIHAELRFAEELIDIDGYEITVSIAWATLFLETWGSTVAPGSRFADVSRSKREYVQTTRRRAMASEALSASGGVSVAAPSGVGANISTNSKNCSEQETEIEVTERLSDSFVKATTGNRWIISESSDGSAATPLDGTYLANDLLCRIKPNEEANSVSIDGMVFTRKRDIAVNAEGTMLQKEYRERMHKNKFFSAILAKSLSETSNQADEVYRTGKIVLSQSMLETDPDDT